MTIPTTSSTITIAGTGANTAFAFPFVADSAVNISVQYQDTNGKVTTLTPSQYTLTINPATSNQLWGVGGIVTYPLTGSPIASGTYLTISRTLPLTQAVSIRNQGDFYPAVIEAGMDTLCMELQQVASRTGLWRGSWVAGAIYNFGDIVSAPAGDANYPNWFMCAAANTASSSFSTDLAAGDWILQFNINALNAVIGAYVPLTGGTISGNLTVANFLSAQNLTVTSLANLLNVVVNGSLTASSPVFAGVPIAPTATTGTNTTQLATTAFVNASTAVAIAGDIKSINIFTLTTSGTYTPSANMKYCIVRLVSAGGGSVAWGGGGAGGYTEGLFTKAQIGASQSCVVGAGANASVGGGSSFGALLVANGGQPGTTFGSGGGGGASGGYASITGGTGTAANATYPGSVMGGSSIFGSHPAFGAGSGVNGSGTGASGVIIITEFLT